jgi:hypothetical protein
LEQKKLPAEGNKITAFLKELSQAMPICFVIYANQKNMMQFIKKASDFCANFAHMPRFYDIITKIN